MYSKYDLAFPSILKAFPGASTVPSVWGCDALFRAAKTVSDVGIDTSDIN